jgi:hypothetical protein
MYRRQNARHRDADGHSDKIPGRSQFGRERLNDHAGLGLSEKSQRQRQDVAVQFGSHVVTGPLTNDGLKITDDIFQAAGKDDGCKIKTAINLQ